MIINLAASTAEALWQRAIEAVRRRGRIQDGRDQETRELLHVALGLRDPRQRLVFSLPSNPAFLIAETIWILSGRNDLEYLAFWNPRMKRWADDDGRMHGAYGERLTQHFNGTNQMEQAFRALQADPTSRQVVLQIWDPVTDLPNPVPRAKDVPCNLNSHLLLRDGKLEWFQNLRSNDLIWGTPTNIFQFTTIQEIMAGWLGAKPGTYNQLSDSLHVYRRHWDLLQEPHFLEEPQDMPVNHADLRQGWDAWNESRWILEGLAVRLAKAGSDQTSQELKAADRLSPGYYDWASVLAAEALRRKGNTPAANRLIRNTSEFWQASWKAWLSSKEKKLPKEPLRTTIQRRIEDPGYVAST